MTRSTSSRKVAGVQDGSCPFCGEETVANASVCRGCGAERVSPAEAKVKPLLIFAGAIVVAIVGSLERREDLALAAYAIAAGLAIFAYIRFRIEGRGYWQRASLRR